MHEKITPNEIKQWMPLTSSVKTLSFRSMMNTEPQIERHISRLDIAFACSAVGFVLTLRNGSARRDKENEYLIETRETRMKPGFQCRPTYRADLLWDVSGRCAVWTFCHSRNTPSSPDSCSRDVSSPHLIWKTWPPSVVAAWSVHQSKAEWSIIYQSLDIII